MTKLQIELLISAIVLLFFILFCLKKNRMTVKYSVMWLLMPIVIILLIIFAAPIADLAVFLGFDLLSNFVFVIIMALILLICFGLTIIVSKQKKQITKLIQEVALLREEINEKKK